MEDYKKTELLSSRIIPQGTEDDHEDTIIATPLLSPPLQIKLNYVEYHAYEFDLSIPAHKSKVSAQKRFFRFLPVFTIVVVKIGVVYWLVWLPMRYIVFPEIIVLIWLLVLILLFFGMIVFDWQYYRIYGPVEYSNMHLRTFGILAKFNGGSSVWLVYHHLGRYHHLCRNYESALECFQKMYALPITQEVPFCLADVYRWKARCFVPLHRYQDALDCIRDCILEKKTYGRSPLPLLGIKNDLYFLAKIQEKLCKYDEALVTYREVVELLQARGHSQSMDLAKAIAKVGEAHQLMGNLTEAREYFENSLRMYRLNIGEFPWQPSIARTHELFGDLLLRMDESPELAVENYEIAVEVYRRSGKSEADRVIINLTEKIQINS